MQPGGEEFEFRTFLAPGRELAYEAFHRAIPADLDTSMRNAGVRSWKIYRNGTVLTHCVIAVDAAAMRAALDVDPVNRRWQGEVVPFLDPHGESGDEPTSRGSLIWDLSWPAR